MKSIDFKKMGVSEMTHSDMLTTEGGSWLSRVWAEIKQGFIDGWNEVKEFFH